MTENVVCALGRVNQVISPSLRSSKRERKRKRRDSECYSEDSAVEMDPDYGSDAEYHSGSSKTKRFKGSGTFRAKRQPTGRTSVDLHWTTRDGEKLLLRQWLLKQADEGAIPGLCWCNKEKTQIRIPWKHGSRTGWTIEDCSVYRAWATYTGKIESIKEPKKWKANFRCALNSLPDVQELKNLSQKKGSDPYKIYLMLPEVPRKSLAKKTKPCKLETIEDEPEDVSPLPLFPTKTHAQQISEIKFKEDESVLEIKTKIENSFWSSSTDLSIEQMETKMHSLIPTVVEELSEDSSIKYPNLTNLQSIGSMIPDLPHYSHQPLSPASSSSSSSSPLSCSSVSVEAINLNECYLEDISLFPDLFDNKLEPYFLPTFEEFDNSEDIKFPPGIFVS